MIRHCFVVEYIYASGIISIITPRMLKWDAMPLNKTMRAAQQAFFGASKEVIQELRPMSEEDHLLIGLKDKET